MPKLPLVRWLPHVGRLGRATRWRRTRGRPRVWAHRGDSAHAPENTLLAFERAIAAGASGIELDVRFDGDRNVVVFHDDELARLTGRPGRMDALPARERAALRVGGEPVPLLADVLAAFDTEFDIEIKATRAGRNGALAAAVAGVIRAVDRASGRPSGRADRVLVTSFDPTALVQFHRHAPELALGYLFHGDQSLPLRRGWAGRWIGASLVHPQHALVDDASVRRWHRAGLPIHAWTVDDPAEIRRLAQLGVDGVITNDPAAALAALG